MAGVLSKGNEQRREKHEEGKAVAWREKQDERAWWDARRRGRRGMGVGGGGGDKDAHDETTSFLMEDGVRPLPPPDLGGSGRPPAATSKWKATGILEQKPVKKKVDTKEERGDGRNIFLSRFYLLFLPSPPPWLPPFFLWVSCTLLPLLFLFHAIVFHLPLSHPPAQ